MRTEKDSMGEMPVPDDALYGASTQRAVLNFPISGRPLPDAFIRGLGVVKSACARANEELGRLAPEKSRLIQAVAREIAEGRLTAQFPIDVFQTGSGTSTNMNANEVIAHRARQLTEQLLRGIRANRAKVVVVDITGVPTIDQTVANHLVKTVEASRLMGASVIITGLSAEIAQTLVTIGVDLSKMNAVGDLQGGIEEAELLLGYKVTLTQPEPAGQTKATQEGNA